MYYTDEFDGDKIIQIIESVEDTLKYTSIELFKKAMQSVGFVVRLLKKRSHYGNLYSCRGKINNQSIHLDIYQKTNNHDVRICVKSYYSEILVSKRVKRLAHRENDLPSIVYYHEENGKVHEQRYFIHGEESRLGNNPVKIFYTYNEKDDLVRTYSRFGCENYLDACEKYLNNFINFSLYDVSYTTNNLIIDCTFCYNNKLLTLKEISLIIPDLKLSMLDDLHDLKKIMTEEQFKLIEMYSI